MSQPGFLWRANRRVWGYRVANRFIFQPADDGHGHGAPLRPLVGPLNRWITERGWCPPWIMTREECEAFWRSRDNTDEGNPPRLFAAKSQAIIAFMHELWRPDVTTDDLILELGPNCGANLNGLWQLGYRRLAGVEINANALAEMKHAFPHIAHSATIANVSIDAYLRAAPSRSVDVVYTMAVLHHLHPTLTDVFHHMARVARRHICVIEAETASCTYQFARDYRRLFERLGCRQLREAVPEVPIAGTVVGGYTARLFAVPR